LTTLAPLLHAQTTDVWELLALVGPFTIVFGAGVLLVIMPIVRTQGERYEHRELQAEAGKKTVNGERHARPEESVEEVPTAPGSKN